MFSQGDDVYDDNDEEEKDTYDDFELDEYDIGSMAENDLLWLFLPDPDQE